MKNERSLLASLFLIAAILLGALVMMPGQAIAYSWPDDAVAPPGDWKPIHDGQEHWYAFYYAGDGSQVDIGMRVEPHDGATFSVWTPEDIERWGQGFAAEPTGRGNLDPFVEGSVVWSGSFRTQGAYYVLVEHAGSQPGASYYLLEISGDGVSLDKPAPEASSEPEAATAPPKAAAPSKMEGKLAFQTHLGGDLYSININGTGLQRLTDGMDPTWSPDGTEIAFARWSDPRGIWTINADGSGEKHVFDWDKARWPTWSLAGTEILFSRQHGGRVDEVSRCFSGYCFTIPPNPFWRLGYVNPENGSFAEPQHNSDVSQAPYWSPEGDRIVFHGASGLIIQSVDGKDWYGLTGDGRDNAPVWSPAEGGQIAYIHYQHDHWEIYGVDADGGNNRRLTNTPLKPNGEPAHSVSPAWSPDGGYVAFLTDRTGKWEIWVMRANGTDAKPLFDTALDGLRLDYGHVAERALSWSK